VSAIAKSPSHAYDVHFKLSRGFFISATIFEYDKRMAQAIVDPEQLRNFAMQLKRFSGLLGDASTKLSQQMQQLAVSWRDQEHMKFSAEFEQEMKQLGRLIDASERHVPYLMRKAELIEEYQRGHG
jgi:uncharacterized protein YukE